MRAVRSYKLTPYSGVSWRCVEHQATIATKNLVQGNLADHDILEALLDENKEPIPRDAEHLHWLAATPFRYFRARESRYGPAGKRGIWYGAETEEVALREFSFHRIPFFEAYEGEKPHTLAVTLIQANLRTDVALNVTAPAFNRQRRAIEDPDSYQRCHEIAGSVIEQGGNLVIYNSARTPPGSGNRACHAVLQPSAFDTPSINEVQAKSMSLTRSAGQIRATRDSTRQKVEFSADSLRWQFT